MTATDDPVERTVPTSADTLAAPTLPDDPDVRRFATELGVLWQQVWPWTTPLDEAASRDLYELMDAVRRQNVAAGLAVSSVSAHAGDLSALRAGWPHFSPGQKAVLNAATAYVLEADRTAVPAADPGEEPTIDGGGACLGEQVALVVSAAVRALLHRR